MTIRKTGVFPPLIAYRESDKFLQWAAVMDGGVTPEISHGEVTAPPFSAGRTCPT
jgi:hypothetical protein